MTVQAHCPKCGKFHEMDDKYKGFVERNNGEVECPECKFGKGKKTANNNGQSKTVQGAVKMVITPAEYHKMYEEFKAEFGEEIKDVELMVGAWITTCLLDKKKSY